MFYQGLHLREVTRNNHGTKKSPVAKWGHGTCTNVHGHIYRCHTDWNRGRCLKSANEVDTQRPCERDDQVALSKQPSCRFNRRWTSSKTVYEGPPPFLSLNQGSNAEAGAHLAISECVIDSAFSWLFWGLLWHVCRIKCMIAAAINGDRTCCFDLFYKWLSIGHAWSEGKGRSSHVTPSLDDGIQGHACLTWHPGYRKMIKQG